MTALSRATKPGSPHVVLNVDAAEERLHVLVAQEGDHRVQGLLAVGGLEPGEQAVEEVGDVGAVAAADDVAQRRERRVVIALDPGEGAVDVAEDPGDQRLQVVEGGDQDHLAVGAALGDEAMEGPADEAEAVRRVGDGSPGPAQ